MEVQMGMTSLQAGMDSWFQGNMQEDNTGIIDSCSSPADASGEDVMLAACTPRSLIERRLRPPHEQSLKCPRCESTHTKFCYYNNYSLSQPRYFCKTCRRYWTKGGTLRNIPVGGGCRKNKKQSTSSNKNNDSSSTSALTNNHQNGTGSLMSPPPPASYDNHNIHHGDQTHLQLAFPEQIHFSSLHTNFFPENNQNTPMDHELALSDHFMGNIGTGENFCGLMNNNSSNNYFNGVNCSPYGLLEYDHLGNSSNTTSGINILESCQRIKVPHDHISYHHHQNHAETQDVKPNGKILSLEWHHLNHHHHHQQQQEEACISGAAEKQSAFGFSFGGLGSWTGLMNGYGSSASNPLV